MRALYTAPQYEGCTWFRVLWVECDESGVIQPLLERYNGLLLVYPDGTEKRTSC